MTLKVLNLFNQLDSGVQVLILIVFAIGIFLLGTLLGDVLYRILSLSQN